MTIRKRILFSMISLTVGCCFVILVSSILLFNMELHNATNNKIDVAAKVASQEIESLKNTASVAAFGMANNNGLIEALVRNNREEISSIARSLQIITQIDYNCTILDKNGIVISRTHEPDRYGDSLAHQPHVKQALNGEMMSCVLQGVTFKLGAYAGAPVYSNGNLIGIVSLGFRLEAEKFASTLKTITDCEITVFMNDQCISSTIEFIDGIYTVGTTAESRISAIVLAGQEYTIGRKLNGRDEIAKYIPIYGVDNKVIGMMCVGYYTADEKSKISFFIISGALITIVVLFACVMIARFISSVVERRLEKMMDEIREANAHTKTMFDVTPMCCTLWNTRIEMIDCNQEALKLFGIDDKVSFKKKFLGMAPEFQHDGTKSVEGAHAALRLAFDQGYLHTEWDHMTASGELLPADVTLVRVNRGDVKMIAGFSRDMREQKAYTAYIEKTKEDLRVACEAAEAASRAKTVFLANMSHEIRTPMNSIIGFSELAQYGDISPKTREYLANISDSAGWLLKIINDILDISKIESGKITLENIAFDLRDILAHCQSVIVPKAAEKGITLYCYAEPSIGKKLVGDPVRLRQIIINLLSNAVKFTNVGTVKFLASLKEFDENHATIIFEIKDSGIGMSRDQILRIFDPFMQADDSVTRRFGGTGLGLTITKNIIELMGGKLIVESTPGVGSKFGFELSFNLIDDDKVIDSESEILKNIDKMTLTGEVLICEDNNLNQQVICDHLSRVGLKTVIANNGKEGVDMVAVRKQTGKKQFDLILMDIHMPVMDGLEAASKIVDLKVNVPVIAVTANIMSNDLDLYKNSGMSDCIGKPFSSQDLWRCLLKYIPAGNMVMSADNTQDDDEDAQFMQKIKITFFNDNQTVGEDIQKAVDDGDIKLAHRLAHTLKSSAAHIGENLLRESAAEVEAMFANGQNLFVKEKYNTMKQRLEEVLAKLAPLAEKKVTAVMSEDEGRKKILEIAGELESMLINRNPQCLNFVEDLKRISGAEALVRAIEKFKFKQAITELAELKKMENK